MALVGQKDSLRLKCFIFRMCIMAKPSFLNNIILLLVVMQNQIVSVLSFRFKDNLHPGNDITSAYPPHAGKICLGGYNSKVVRHFGG